MLKINVNLIKRPLQKGPNMSDHLVLGGQQLCENSFFEVSFVLWAALLFQMVLQILFLAVVYHCSAPKTFFSQNFNIRFSKSELMSMFAYQQPQQNREAWLGSTARAIV